jgi:hypothetical protein
VDGQIQLPAGSSSGTACWQLNLLASVQVFTKARAFRSWFFGAQGWRCSTPCGSKATDELLRRAQRVDDDEDGWADRQDLKSFDRIGNTTDSASESTSINPRG